MPVLPEPPDACGNSMELRCRIPRRLRGGWACDVFNAQFDPPTPETGKKCATADIDEGRIFFRWVD